MEWMEKLKAKLDELSNVVSTCWLCGEKTNRWGVIVPDETQTVGFGQPENENATRIAFFPLCETHDWNDQEIQTEIKRILKVKTQAKQN